MKSRLYRERKARKWTQVDTAKRLGITQRGYRYIESGQKKPSFDVGNKLEEIFGISSRELLAVDSSTDGR